MEAVNGRFIFENDDLQGIVNSLKDTPYAERLSIDSSATTASGEESDEVITVLHAACIDPRLSEAQREEVANQLLYIGRTGLKSSIKAEEEFIRFKQATSLTSAL